MSYPIGLKILAPLFHRIRSETESNCDSFAQVFRPSRQLHVITLSFDWFTGLSVFLVIGQSDDFGFGFTIFFNGKLL